MVAREGGVTSPSFHIKTGEGQVRHQKSEKEGPLETNEFSPVFQVRTLIPRDRLAPAKGHSDKEGRSLVRSHSMHTKHIGQCIAKYHSSLFKC